MLLLLLYLSVLYPGQLAAPVVVSASCLAQLAFGSRTYPRDLRFWGRFSLGVEHLFSCHLYLSCYFIGFDLPLDKTDDAVLAMS